MLGKIPKFCVHIPVILSTVVALPVSPNDPTLPDETAIEEITKGVDRALAIMATNARVYSQGHELDIWRDESLPVGISRELGPEPDASCDSPEVDVFLDDELAE